MDHSTKSNHVNNQTSKKSSHVQYNTIVIDANAIIKGAGLTHLLPSVTPDQQLNSFYTVPGVLNEIQDKKARHHLDSLPFPIHTREPTPHAIQTIMEFSKQTGDYRSLSLVDLHVLALTYDLEVLGCGGKVEHLRLEPKRMVGGGRVVSLNTNKKEEEGKEKKEAKDKDVKMTSGGIMERSGAYEIQIEADEEGSNDASDNDEEDEEEEGDTESETESDENEEEKKDVAFEPSTSSKPKLPSSWASIVHPGVTSTESVKQTLNEQDILSKPFGQMNLSQSNPPSNHTSNQNSIKPKTFTEIQQEQEELEKGGQFSDAEEDNDDDIMKISQIKESNDCNNDDDDDYDDEYGMQYADSDAEMSDEDCDVYILDPEEVDARKKGQWKGQGQSSDLSNNPVNDSIPTSTTATTTTTTMTTDSLDPLVEQELKSDFPSLSAASTIPYEGSDEEVEQTTQPPPPQPQSSTSRTETSAAAATTATNKKWNSWGKDKHMFSSKGVMIQHSKGRTREERKIEWEREKERMRLQLLQERHRAAAAAANANALKNNKTKTTSSKSTTSRIIGGGMELSGQSEQVDDDGEGWISVSNIRSLKANGGMNHGFSMQSSSQKNNNNHNNGNNNSIPSKKNTSNVGPPPSQRCACATTDFAMQNILLQMGLVLLSIDGMAIRKVKHWVTRCATCFTVYGGGVGLNSNGNQNKLGGRLFCDKCGGSYLERVSASVDSKTGRFRLHLSKRRRHNKRGTKFSLPKPGKGNRFEGDLLLREDQLMMGAWNQKVKKGSKSMESMFGADIASHVGLGDLSKRSDINVGFGRRNPNSSKFGRERRGKKKKTTDKACGLRRY